MSASLLEIVGDVFELSQSEVDEDASPENTPSWDSLGSVRLMMALQETYGVEFTNGEMLAMRSVALIRRVLRKKGITVQ